jgi:hypothetical protein
MSQAGASDKMTRQQAQYQDTPNGIYSCGLCTLFERPKPARSSRAKSAGTAGARPLRWRISARVPGAMQRVALPKRCFAEPGPRLLRAASNRGHSASKTRVNALMAKSYALRCVRGTRVCKPFTNL